MADEEERRPRVPAVEDTETISRRLRELREERERGWNGGEPATELLLALDVNSLPKAEIYEDMNELELRELSDRQRAEAWEKFGPMLDVMLLEAQNLRLQVGHKARERTLCSLRMDRKSA